MICLLLPNDLDQYFNRPSGIILRFIKTIFMSIVKVIEVLAESPKSWEDAAQQAVHEASKTVHNIRSLYIKDHSVVLDKNNKIETYRINAKLSFEVETPQKNLSAKG